jgi:hypothetical protein
MKKKLHKTLLALVLVMIPPYFLVFTEEGNRVSDNVMLWLFGRENFEFNLKQADTAYTEAQIKKVFPDIDWRCGAVESQFGQYACNAVIGSFNGLPANRVVLYFVHDHLNAAQIDYRAQYHNALLTQLLDSLGQPINATEAASDAPDADPVVQWQTGKGLVVLKKTIRESDQPALFWLGSAQ